MREPLRLAAPLQRQHQLMVLGLDTPTSRSLLAEMQKTADLVAKLGQRRIVRLR